MYSIDHSHSPHPNSPFLLCPLVRVQKQYRDKYPDDREDVERYLVIKSPYCVNEPLNDGHHIRPLHGCNNKEGEPNGFQCYACWLPKIGTTYYFCDACCESYHKECVESPPEINVPAYHPKHPLQLKNYYYSLDRTVSHCCGNLNTGFLYNCNLCAFSMHPVCAREPPLLSIYHPKCHEHTLMYFHRKASLACNICGFDDERYFFYICLQCDFVVHKACIYLPRVIMVSRHNHRLSFMSSLPSGKWSCGVCHKKINESYGEYLCVKGCEYAIHSNCATGRRVWDGRELEDEPENEEENTASFVLLGDGTIRYFSHHHPLRLFEKIAGGYEENTYCQACNIPLYYEENIYKCEHCDFNLHQTCADLPLKKRHVSHRHPLILKADCGNWYNCRACHRIFSGFQYECSEGCSYHIDVKCGMVSEPVDYCCHPHPLFLRFQMGEYRKCWNCLEAFPFSLDCIVCDFSSCFKCATLPCKVRYEHDDHLLMLSRVEKQNGRHWCEACEKDVFETAQEDTGLCKGVYTCNKCSVTLHIDCAIGLDLLQKPGLTIQDDEEKVDVLANSNLTRPICNLCKRHCQYKLLFKLVESYRVLIFCSVRCLDNYL